MMNGIIKQTVMAAWVTGSLALTGCHQYHDLVDPCYPERYAYAARSEVRGAFAPQVSNGHVLDQTVWNSHFEAGSEKLTVGGMDHLAYLARRRPHPDAMIYLQTAQDVVYDAANPDKFADARAGLDNRRSQSIRNYLNAQTAGRHVDFQVVVHDPSQVGQPATPVGISVQQMYGGAKGVLPSGAGVGATSVGGGGTAGR